MSKSNTILDNILEADFPYSGNVEAKFRFLLNYAVRAPSHQNTQPWKFRINATSLDIMIDRERALTFVDPNFRELIISCGAAVQMIEVAARYFGFEPVVTLSPDKSTTDWLAQVELKNDYQPTRQDKKIFRAIKHRQTNRRWFDDSQVADSVLQECLTYAPKNATDLHFSNDKHLKTEFAALTALAVRMQFSQPWYRLELASNFSSRLSMRKNGMRSYGFSPRQLPTPINKILFQSFDMGKEVSKYNQQKIQTGSPALGVFSSPQDNQNDWVNIGRALSHTLLTLTSHGFCVSYMNQSVQVESLRLKLKNLLKIDGIPQLVIRIGKADSVVPTPRRAVDDCIDKAD
jgi:hypothetical protein